MTGPWLEIWKECCFALNWLGPSKQTEIDVMFVQRRQEYGNWFMNHAIMRHGVFIDECGYNILTARNHGRAKQGELAYLGPKYRLEWYPVERDANPIATQGSSALHRCYSCS